MSPDDPRSIPSARGDRFDETFDEFPSEEALDRRDDTVEKPSTAIEAASLYADLPAYQETSPTARRWSTRRFLVWLYSVDPGARRVEQYLWVILVAIVCGVGVQYLLDRTQVSEAPAPPLGSTSPSASSSIAPPPAETPVTEVRPEPLGRVDAPIAEVILPAPSTVRTESKEVASTPAVEAVRGAAVPESSVLAEPEPPPPALPTAPPAASAASVIEPPADPAPAPAPETAPVTVGTVERTGTLAALVPAPAAIVPVPAAVNDRMALDRLLKAYQDSYNRLDAAAVATNWPTVDTRALSRAFGTIAEQDLSFDRCDMQVDGSRATALCEGSIRYVRRTGDQTPRVQSASWSFDFRRTGERWQISKVIAH
jgi:hypothetical protein